MQSGRLRRIDPAPLSSLRRRGASRIALLAIWVVFSGLAQPARAEVRISGGAGAVTIEAPEVTLEEVLRALQASFKFHFRSTGSLDRVIVGTYSGSLPHVIARLLEDTDYVMKSSPTDLTVVIFGPGKPMQVTGPTDPAANHTAGTGPPPLKECIYKDGDRVIPVEC